MERLLVGYTISLGDFHCPMCAMVTEFMVPPEANQNVNEQYAKAECCVCGYSFGYYHDEKVLDGSKYTTIRRPVLTPEVVAKGHARRVERYRNSMLRSGVRLERLNRAKGHASDG